MSVNESLACNCYHSAAAAHIEIQGQDEQQLQLLEKCCPAGLFQRNAAGRLVFNYHGCLECGCCRMIIADATLKTWRYPPSGSGIIMRFG